VTNDQLVFLYIVAGCMFSGYMYMFALPKDIWEIGYPKTVAMVVLMLSIVVAAVWPILLAVKLVCMCLPPDNKEGR
jgi:hypothetical protein